MASIHNDIALPVPARDVWDAVRDFGALPQRLAPGFVTACTLDGDARIVTFANGSVAREVLVDCDDARQRLVYAINNERLKHYNASVQVIADGEARCRLVWIIDILPNELAAYVQGANQGSRGRHTQGFSVRGGLIGLCDFSHRTQPSSAVTMAACVRLAPLSRRRHAREEHAMRGADKVICQAAAVLLLFSVASTPAKAQFLGGGAGGEDMMTQMAPMLEMMKAKMGKRRFAMMMQTMGPMMSRMMENGGGGLGGMMGGGGIGGLAGGNFGGGFGAPNYGGYAPMSGGGYAPAGIGGGDIMGMMGGACGGDMMAMIPQLMRLANVGGGGGHRRHKHR